MIESNVIKGVKEAFGERQIALSEGERMGEAVARALHVSEAQAGRWLEALGDGCTLEEANIRAGISPTNENESLLTAIARSIGAFVGKMAS